MSLHQVRVIQGATYRPPRNWSPNCCCLCQESSPASRRLTLYVCCFLFPFLVCRDDDPFLSPASGLFPHTSCITALYMQEGALLKLGLSAELEQKTHLHHQPHFTSVSACSSPSHPFQGCLGLLLPRGPAQALFFTSDALTHPTPNLQHCLIWLILTTFISDNHSLPGWTQSALRTDSLQPFHGVRVSLPSLGELFFPRLTPGTLLQRITIELLEHFVPQEPVCLGTDIPMDLCESPAPLLGQHKLQPQLTLRSPWRDRAQPSSGRLCLTAPWMAPFPSLSYFSHPC